ncbi:POTRA domain-containing protein [Nostoc sp.]
MRVDRIQVVGSTVFKPEQFATVTAPFVGRELTFAELLQVRDAMPVWLKFRGDRYSSFLVLGSSRYNSMIVPLSRNDGWRRTGDRRSM